LINDELTVQIGALSSFCSVLQVLNRILINRQYTDLSYLSTLYPSPENIIHSIRRPT